MESIDWKNISWKELKIKLSDDPNFLANLELARRIVNNYEVVINNFFGEMSKGLIRKLEQIMSKYDCDVFSEYFIFLSSPFDPVKKENEWHRISLYKALNDCKLISYVSSISCRYFYKLAKKEKKNNEIEEELLEYTDYEGLLLCDQEEEDDDNPNIKRMKQAYQDLPKRDQLVLRYMIIEKKSSIEAYNELEPLIHPIPKDGMTSEQVKNSWSIKRRQDAMGLMKGYALNKVLKKYNELKRNNYE